MDHHRCLQSIWGFCFAVQNMAVHFWNSCIVMCWNMEWNFLQWHLVIASTACGTGGDRHIPSALSSQTFSCRGRISGCAFLNPLVIWDITCDRRMWGLNVWDVCGNCSPSLLWSLNSSHLYALTPLQVELAEYILQKFLPWILQYERINFLFSEIDECLNYVRVFL